MTTNYHTPWVDGVTQWLATDMNAPLAALDQAITNINTAGELTGYIVSFFWVETISNSQIMMIHVGTSIEPTFDSGLAGSYATCETAPSAQQIFSIKLNGVEVGTITFAISATTAVVTSSAEFTVLAGDKLSVVAPASADASIDGIAVSILGNKPAPLATTTTTTAPPITTTTTV